MFHRCLRGVEPYRTRLEASVYVDVDGNDGSWRWCRNCIFLLFVLGSGCLFSFHHFFLLRYREDWCVGLDWDSDMIWGLHSFVVILQLKEALFYQKLAKVYGI